MRGVTVPCLAVLALSFLGIFGGTSAESSTGQKQLSRFKRTASWRAELANVSACIRFCRVTRTGQYLIKCSSAKRRWRCAKCRARCGSWPPSYVAFDSSTKE